MAPLAALHRSSVPPSGASHALSCRLVSSSQHRAEGAEKVLGQLVTARNSVVRVYEVLERDVPGEAKSARLSHLLTRRLPGVVASLARVRTLASKQDGCDRILASFLDAKMSLLEWSPDEHDLVPVSLHTFEKLPQVAEDRPHLLAVDPSSRLAAMLLPTNTGGDGTLALLPFFGEELDWDSLGMDREGWESSQQQPNGTSGSGSGIPYARSHLLPLASLSSGSSVPAATAAARSSTLASSSHIGANAFVPGLSSPPIRNVVSMAFLPGFTEATLALLYAPDWTWSGRLEHLAHNYLVSLVTLTSSSAAAPAGSTSSPTRAVVIATSPPLPYSCLSLNPCPSTLGGVLLTTANGLLHLDQSGRVVAAPTTAWLARDYPPGRARPVGLDDEGGQKSAELAEPLEGAQVEFLTHAADDEDEEGGSDELKALVWTPSGAVLALSFVLTGRTIARLELERVAHGRGLTGGGASVVRRVPGRRSGYVFVGSEQGDSGLCRWRSGQEGVAVLPAVEEKPAMVDAGMDLDDDEDLYNTSSVPDPVARTTLSSAQALVSTSSATSSKLELRVCDIVAGYGAVRALCVGLVDDESPAELVAATGAGKSAGLTVFHRTLPSVGAESISVHSPSLDASSFVASDGMWRMRLSDEKGSSSEIWVLSGKDGTMVYHVIPSSDSSNSPSHNLLLHLASATLAAGTFPLPSSFINTPGRNALVLAHRDSLSSYTFSPSSSSLDHLHSLPYPHAAHPSAHPPHASFSSDHLLIHLPVTQGVRSRTRPVLYRFSAGAGADESPELVEFPLAGASGVEGSRAAVFADEEGTLALLRPAASARKAAASGPGSAVPVPDAMEEDEDALYGGGATAETVEASAVVQPDAEIDDVADIVAGREFFAEVDKAGSLKILLFPDVQEIFSSASICLLPSVISDGVTSEDLSIPSTIDPDDIKVDRVLVKPVGPAGHKKIHLFVLLTNGTLAVYEAFDAAVKPISPSSPSSPRLAARFVKTLVRQLAGPLPRRKGAAASDLPPPRRDLVTFDNVGGQNGVFVTGEEGLWIVKDEHGPVRAVEHAERGVYGIASTGNGEFLMQTRQGLHRAHLPPSLSFSSPLAFSRIPKERVYGHLAFDLEAGMYVAATLNETQFVAFDEEGVPVFKDEAPGLVTPVNYQSTLEVLAPGSWQAIHGYEFRQNEFVTALKSVSLASRSRASGQRDFIAVGTAVYRGEDLATRGGLYVFELVKVNAHPSSPQQDHVLKLLFSEDTKAVVSNVCDLNGYLFLSMGQKLYARAFEQDEFLLSVGFLDVGVHVTSLQAMKNFLLIGDAAQSAALVAFQEDPYKLVLLGRDYRPAYVSSANFLVNEGKVAFISNDDRGVIRLFEYDPTNIASYAGQRLLCRTEFFAGDESTATMLFAKHQPGEDAKQNGILYGGLDGSFSTLVPVRDAVFKRLQSVQAMMTRHVLHFAGLNPRGYRIVKNDTVSRALQRGILDGDVLASFEYLSLDLQTELAEACGTDADTVRANLRSLRGWE
ncbi:hypothetical protein JCM8547_006821 [Rhodosporidiobolus lusitaniae]